MISDNARSGMQQAPARSLFNALGFTAEELKKPMVGIVSYRLYFRQSRYVMVLPWDMSA